MRADLTKVRQALFNLLSNAAKFTNEAEITLSARKLVEVGGGQVEFTVSDQGIGIPAAKLDAIFEEFSQAEESTSRDFGGTGLGLAITKRFCQMMGGDIEVTSTPGRGSSFTIRLPEQVETVTLEQHEPRTEPTPISAGAEGAPTVLVVDDDPVAIDLISRSLQGAGFRVVTAGDGEEALHLARTLAPSAITLDVVMPGMDGWSVLQALKADPETCDIPVIMATMLDDIELGAALGATDFLTKPIERKQLVRLLQRHAASGAERNVLVVDDTADVRDMLRRSMEHEGWNVSEAENGRVALERMAEATPSLVLLDLMMPVMDGFEFVMEVRANPVWCAIPIVVVTAKDLTDEDRRRLNGNVVGLIEKRGTALDELLVQIRDLVATSHDRSPDSGL
jgi:CheY-like chemotaxis protein/anti-sigma regulatory factor (Ser/Thr protein kinase)